MSGRQLYRRNQKTIQLLQNALAELIAEKAYDDITIQEILDRANVGRSTFYTHFENKDQLLRSMLTLLNERFEEGIRQLSAGQGRFEDNSANMPFNVLRFVQQHHRLFRAMLGTQDQRARNPLYDYLFASAREHFRSMAQRIQRDPLRTELAANFYASAFIGALVWWLENDMAYSPEVFGQMLNQLILPGLESFLGIETPGG